MREGLLISVCGEDTCIWYTSIALCTGVRGGMVQRSRGGNELRGKDPTWHVGITDSCFLAVSQTGKYASGQICERLWIILRGPSSKSHAHIQVMSADANHDPKASFVSLTGISRGQHPEGANGEHDSTLEGLNRAAMRAVTYSPQTGCLRCALNVA